MADNPVRRVVGAGLDVVGRYTEWWELPLPAQLLQLAHFREDLRRFNLYDTEQPENGAGVTFVSEPPSYRTYDGSQTDPANPKMGQTGTRFGRNMPLDATYPQEQSVLDPSPREVSNHLLNRDRFKPATTLNVLAAMWLQFQNHDWFSHGDNSETEFIQVPLSEDDNWDGGVMEVRRTSPDSTNSGGKLPPTYLNKVTPWWDGSQLYGSTEERNRELRSGEDGKLKMENGRLPEETDTALHGIDLTASPTTTGLGCPSCTRCSLVSTTRSATCSRLTTRPGAMSSCS